MNKYIYFIHSFGSYNPARSSAVHSRIENGREN